MTISFMSIEVFGHVGTSKFLGDAQHSVWKCSYRSLIKVYIWVLSNLQNAMSYRIDLFWCLLDKEALSYFSNLALNPERLPHAKGYSCIQNTIKQ